MNISRNPKLIRKIYQPKFNNKMSEQEVPIDQNKALNEKDKGKFLIKKHEYRTIFLEDDDIKRRGFDLPEKKFKKLNSPDLRRNYDRKNYMANMNNDFFSKYEDLIKNKSSKKNINYHPKINKLKNRLYYYNNNLSSNHYINSFNNEDVSLQKINNQGLNNKTYIQNNHIILNYHRERPTQTSIKNNSIDITNNLTNAFNLSINDIINVKNKYLTKEKVKIILREKNKIIEDYKELTKKYKTEVGGLIKKNLELNNNFKSLQDKAINQIKGYKKEILLLKKSNMELKDKNKNENYIKEINELKSIINRCKAENHELKLLLMEKDKIIEKNELSDKIIIKSKSTSRRKKRSTSFYTKSFLEDIYK